MSKKQAFQAQQAAATAAALQTTEADKSAEQAQTEATDDAQASTEKPAVDEAGNAVGTAGEQGVEASASEVTADDAGKTMGEGEVTQQESTQQEQAAGGQETQAQAETKTIAEPEQVAQGEKEVVVVAQGSSLRDSLAGTVGGEKARGLVNATKEVASDSYVIVSVKDTIANYEQNMRHGLAPDHSVIRNCQLSLLRGIQAVIESGPDFNKGMTLLMDAFGNEENTAFKEPGLHRGHDVALAKTPTETKRKMTALFHLFAVASQLANPATAYRVVDMKQVAKVCGFSEVATQRLMSYFVE